MNTLEILIISDGKIGHFNQSLGILKALKNSCNLQYSILEIKLKNSFFKKILQIGLNLKFLRKFFKNPKNLKYINFFYNNFKLNKRVDIIISSGKNTAFLSAWLSLAYKSKNIFSGNIRGVDSELFSAILSVIDLGLKNQIIIDVAPSDIDSETLKTQAQKLNLNPNFTYFSLLIGGNTSEYTYQKEDILALIKNLKILKKEQNIKWLITTSRRSDEMIEQLLSENLKDEYLIIYNQNPKKVLNAFLGLSKVIFVTEDSASMISEAICTNKPVFSLYPKKYNINKNYNKIIDKFINLKLLKRVFIRDKFEIDENYFHINEVEMLQKLSNKLKEFCE